MRALRFISDIHIEKIKNDHPRIKNLYNDTNKNKYQKYDLAVVGDFSDYSPSNKKKLQLFFTGTTKCYHNIYFIPGNHEYFNTKQIPKYTIDGELGNVCKLFPNVHYLNNSVVDNKDGVRFIGSSLWSHIPEEYSDNTYSTSNIFKNIYCEMGRPISVELYNQWNRESVLFIKKELDKNMKKNINFVLTHYCPLFSKGHSKITHHEYNDKSSNFMFSNDLGHLVQRSNYWIYGHTHYRTMFQMTNKKTVIASSPLLNIGPKKNDPSHDIILY